MCKYYIVISDTLILLDVFFLLLAVILSELHENLRKKDLSYRKDNIEEYMWGTSLFWAARPLLMSLFVAFTFTPYLSCTTILLRKSPLPPSVYDPVMKSQILDTYHIFLYNRMHNLRLPTLGKLDPSWNNISQLKLTSWYNINSWVYIKIYISKIINLAKNMIRITNVILLESLSKIFKRKICSESFIFFKTESQIAAF